MFLKSSLQRKLTSVITFNQQIVLKYIEQSAEYQFLKKQNSRQNPLILPGIVE